MPKLELFNNLVLLASADGKLTQEEVAYLVQKAENWDISPDDVESALVGASTGEGEITIPEDQQERVEMITEMIRLMAADGHLAEIEKRLCATASAAMDFSTVEFDGILQAVLEG